MNRTSVVLLSIAVICPVSVAIQAQAPTDQQRIEAEIRAFKGEMGVSAINLVTGETMGVNADRRFPTASAIKTAVMVEAYHQIHEGRLSREQVVPLTDRVKVGGSGVLQPLHAGLNLTVKDLLWLMIVVSDNTATNLLVPLVGTANVDRRLESYGLADIKLFRPTFRDGHPDVFPELEKEFGLGMSTPRDMTQLMALIADGKIVDRATCDEMIAMLNEQQDNTMIPRILPSADRIVVGHKTGTDEEKALDANGVHRHVRSDAAIVVTPTMRYAISIFTRQVEDTNWGVDNAALVTGARVSRLVYDHFKAAPRNP